MTFARVAKVLAALFVGAALWWARPPEPPARIAFLALPGASSDVFPAGGRLSSPGAIEGPASAIEGAAFWRRLLAAAADDGRDPLDLAPLWSAEAGAIGAFAVPARLFVPSERQGAVEGTFLGGSTGVGVRKADLSSGRLPVPYDRSLEILASASTQMRPGDWSDWIPLRPRAAAVEGGAGLLGEFQFARVTEDEFFLTPVYRTPAPERIGSPFLRGLHRDVRPIVVEHTFHRAARLAESWPEQFRRHGRGALIFFDTVAEDAASVFAPDSVPSAIVDRLHDAISTDLAILRRSVGDHGLVVVVGGPASSRGGGKDPWYAIVEGGEGLYAGGSVVSAPLRFEATRVLVRYLAGVELEDEERPLLPKEIALQYPIPVTMAALADAPEPSPPEESWSASSIELLRGALGLGG